MNDIGNKAGPRAKASRIKLVPFDKIELGREPRYLVQGLIPRVGITVIWGPPKSGKSFWTFDVAMHIALGREYRGRSVQEGAVIYCAFEGQSGIRARCEAFRLRLLAENSDPVPFFLEPLTLDLARDAQELIGAIRCALPSSPVAVVLDTLNRSLRGSENSDEDMSAYVRAADALREAFDCAVLIVHHSGIEASRPRGHTSLTGAADAQLAVKRDGAGNIILTVEAMKDGSEGDSIVSRLEVVDVGKDADGTPITSCIVVPVEGYSPKKQSKRPRQLPASAKIALEALAQAVIEGGAPAPASNHIPKGAQTVTESLWRKYAYQRGISSGGDRAKQLAFTRGAEKLLAENIVGKWGELCWLI